MKNLLADCKAPCCATLETKLAHEANCEWCRARPTWRLISHNITIQLNATDTLRTKAAKISSTLGLMSYINDNAIGFTKAHEKFKLVVIAKCKEIIPELDDSPILRMVCKDLIYKLNV